MNEEGPFVTSVQVCDPEMLAGAIHNVQLKPLQLSVRPACSALIRIRCPNICLDMVSLGPAMLFTGGLPRDCYTLIYVNRCPGVGRSFSFSTDHTDGYLGLFAPGAILDAYTPAGMGNSILTVPAEIFRRAVAVYFPEMPEELLERGAAMRVGGIERKLLGGLLEEIEEFSRDPAEPLASELARLQLERDLLFAFVAAVRSGCESKVPEPKARLARRYRHLLRARGFVASHRREALHVDELAAELHLSERGLECLFHDFLGVAPSVFLRHERLHGAHRALELAAPGPGVVKAIALTWGFLHQGRFAHDYRQLFGESPSESLARSRHS